MNRARTRFSIPPQLGFSLVELIVVIVVLGTVASMGAIVVRDGMLGYLRGREITSADWQGRLALERITRELRDVAAPDSAHIDASFCGSSGFSFVDITANQISYSYSSVSNTLWRNGQPLADNVAGLGFYCLQSDGQTSAITSSAVYYISVSMVVSTPNTSATYRSTVKPRSF